MVVVVGIVVVVISDEVVDGFAKVAADVVEELLPLADAGCGVGPSKPKTYPYATRLLPATAAVMDATIAVRTHKDLRMLTFDAGE